MTTERNKEIVRRMVEEGTNGTNLAVLDEVIAPYAVDHTGPPGQVPGPEGIKRGLEEFRSAFPDAEATIETMVAEGDMVSCRVTMRGTNSGPFMGEPPYRQGIRRWFPDLGPHRRRRGRRALELPG